MSKKKGRATRPEFHSRHLHALLSEGKPPATPRLLHQFLREVLNVSAATAPVLQENAAPFDYLVHTFFEGSMSPLDGGVRAANFAPTATPADAVVWAARGAGKTFLGAVATTLDLIFKPGIEIRILGGSLEQSQRMHEHLRRLFEVPLLAARLAERITDRRVVLANGSCARILSQSQTSVRGTRVQKLRCDEVELFDPEVWQAAQLTTRSMHCPGPWGSTVRGSVEALSTMHHPYGLMWKLVGEAGRHPERECEPHIGMKRWPTEEERAAQPMPRRLVFRWGLIDVLSRCGPAHECGSCVLQPDCRGRAKKRDGREGIHAGHLAVDDAARMKTRVSLTVWQSEMLCLRPRRTDAVFPEFDAGVHVGDWTAPVEPTAVPHPDAGRVAAFDLPARQRMGRRRWVAGMDFGFRAPTVVLLGWYREDDPERVLHIEAEHAASEWTVDQHARLLMSERAPGWPDPLPAIDWVGVDPAGHQRSSQTGASSIAALRKHGLTVRARRMPLHEGLELVRARLRPAAGSQDGAGPTPKIFIHRRCTTLIESLTRYHFPAERPESLDPVKDGADHAADALRYLVAALDHHQPARLSTY